MKRVEYDPGFGWIARRRDGTEVMKDFRWASRSVARTVTREADWTDARTSTDGGRDG